jgi:hypothetical protein
MYEVLVAGTAILFTLFYLFILPKFLVRFINKVNKKGDTSYRVNNEKDRKKAEIIGRYIDFTLFFISIAASAVGYFTSERRNIFSIPSEHLRKVPFIILATNILMLTLGYWDYKHNQSISALNEKIEKSRRIMRGVLISTIFAMFIYFITYFD